MADVRCEQAESLVAALIAEVVSQAIGTSAPAPDAVTVSYPATWGSYKQVLLTGALQAAGLPDTRLISGPAAAMMNAVGVNSPYSTVIVYDLGGDGFEASVISRTTAGAFELRGRSVPLDGVGGGDFDQAVFSYVQQAAGLGAPDIADPEVVAALGKLRVACRTAKEALSLDTEVTIPVHTPHLHTRIRLVRSDFEDLIRDAIEDTLDATHRCVGAAGLTTQDIDAIVLVGGSARIPLVAQIISTNFEIPLIIGNHPDASIALGAAQFAAMAVQPALAAAAAELVVTQPSKHSESVPASLVAAESVTPFDQALGDEPQPAVRQARQVALVPIPPTPPAVAGQAPADFQPAAPRADRGGRHRHPGRRSNWFRTTGIVASVAGVFLLGSSIATSRAAEVQSPDTGSRVSGTAGATTSPVVDTRSEPSRPTTPTAPTRQRVTAAPSTAAASNAAPSTTDGFNARR